MKKTILTYGLLSGAVAAILMVGSAIYLRYSNNYNNGEIIGYVGILLSMLFVFIGVRNYRDTVQEGHITFGKAFLVGILITVVSCLCYVVAWLFVYQTIMPDFLEHYMSHALEQMKQAGSSAAEISQKMQKMEEFKVMYQNPFIRFGLTFLEPFPVGFLVTLVSAIALRRQAA